MAAVPLQDARHLEPLPSVLLPLLPPWTQAWQGRFQSCSRGRPSQGTRGQGPVPHEDEYRRLHKVISQRFPEHLAEFVVSVKTGMRLTEQYTCRWSQVHLKRRAIELTKTKNGSDRTVDLNDDAVAAIKSVQRPNQKPGDYIFPRKGATFLRARGSSPVWKRQRSLVFCGTAIGIPFAPGLRWPEPLRRTSRLPQVTRALPWLHATAIYLPNTGLPSWTLLGERVRAPRNMHLEERRPLKEPTAPKHALAGLSRQWPLEYERPLFFYLIDIY